MEKHLKNSWLPLLTSPAQMGQLSVIPGPTSETLQLHNLGSNF